MEVGAFGFYAEVECAVCGARSRVNDTLANFRIEGVLGVGGMSVVYRARDLVLGRELAIKVLNDLYGDNPERISRFEDECALMAKVRHENVVSVYSAGWAKGRFYIAMEMVEGRNLELLLEEHRCLMQDEALDVVHQVAAGLQAAQLAGVLHRDMKPGNVIITPEGRAKVLDFGLALEDRPDALKEEIIWATPFYVPPETLMGQTEDARTDIYALGMTLRGLVTGVTNFSVAPQGFEELLEFKRRMKPVQEMYPNLDEGLCDLINRMTAFQPENRPAGYAELLDEISEVQAAVGGVSQELARSRRRRAWWIGGSVGVAALGAVAAVLSAFLSPRPAVQEFVTVPSRVVRSDFDLLTAACDCLKEEEYERAAEIFTNLAASETSAPSSRLAAMLMLPVAELPLQRESAADAELYARQVEAAAAGKPYEQRLAAACRELSKNGSLPAGMMPASLPAPLKSGVLLQSARQYMTEGNLSSAMACLEAAEISMRLSEVTAPLVAEVQQLRQNLPRRMAAAGRARVRTLMASGQVAQALDVLSGLNQELYSPLERAELLVQSEVCRVAVEAFALLERRCGNQFSPTADPGELKGLAAMLAQDKLSAEMYALAWLLRGEYAKAFEVNPYRNSPDSRAPFAILMRHWHSLLEL